jgi:Gram-negative bacterial TonB protein C-terminal
VRRARGAVWAALVMACASCQNKTENSVLRPDSLQSEYSQQCSNSNFSKFRLQRHEQNETAKRNQMRRLIAQNAEQDAREAMERGEYRFGVASLYVPGWLPDAIGVVCRPEILQMPNHAMELFGYAASDVPMRGDLERRQKFARYAPRYNRTLVESQKYPYKDLCRPAPQDRKVSAIDTKGIGPAKFGFRDLEETKDPIDLHEAARRGSTMALVEMLEMKRFPVNKPDILGMTPLAWAVAYGRVEQARLLLEGGADPAGTPCNSVDDETSPTRIARQLGEPHLVAALAQYSVKPGFRPLPPNPIPAVDGVKSYLGSAKISAIALKSKREELRLVLHITVSNAGRVSKCSVSKPSGLQELDEIVCQTMLANFQYRPAIDEFHRAGSVEMEEPLQFVHGVLRMWPQTAAD